MESNEKPSFSETEDSTQSKIDQNISKAVLEQKQSGADWEESKDKNDKEEELTAEDMEYITKMQKQIFQLQENEKDLP